MPSNPPGSQLPDDGRRPHLRTDSTAERVAIVMPALNEEETIGEVVSRIPRVLPGVDWVKVIVVDDGSGDRTQQRAIDAGADVIVAHARNRGLVAAFTRGVNEAMRQGASIVVHLDADGQHDPAEIPRLVAPIVARDADLTLGVRDLGATSKEHMTSLRRHGNRVGSWACGWLLGTPTSDATSGFRAFSRDTLLELNLTSEHTYTIESLLLASRKRMRMVEVPISVNARLVGESRMTHNLLRYVSRTGGQAIRATLHQRPLAIFGRLAGLLGIIALSLMVAFLAMRWSDDGAHQTMLLLTVISYLAAGALFLVGLLADAMAINRRLLEDVLYHVKRVAFEPAENTPPSGD